MSRVLIRLIRLYQRCISIWLPPVCRFYPSCSEYTVQAIRARGLWLGVWLGVRRLVSCHPFHPGGYDPVPAPELKHGEEKPSHGVWQKRPKGQVCR